MADLAQKELLEHFCLNRHEVEHADRRKRREQWVRQDQIGQGSMGVVYLEELSDKSQLRAVKEIRKRPQYDFKRELNALTRPSKPAYADHFGKFLGWFDDAETISFAMEYFELGDLRRYMDDPIPENEVKDIAYDLLSGLQVMHQDGFTHRDLKPENIFVVRREPSWRVKIGDFGVSKRVQGGDTILQTFVGTQHYIAPEVLGFLDDDNYDNDDDHDDRSTEYTSAVDIWAVGVIVYEAASGTRPFANHRALGAFCRGSREFPTPQQQGKISIELIDFIKKCLTINPRVRLNAEKALHEPWLRLFVENPGNDIDLSSMPIVPKVLTNIYGAPDSLRAARRIFFKVNPLPDSARIPLGESEQLPLHPMTQDLNGNADSSQQSIADASTPNLASASRPERHNSVYLSRINKERRVDDGPSTNLNLRPGHPPTITYSAEIRQIPQTWVAINDLEANEGISAPKTILNGCSGEIQAQSDVTSQVEPSHFKGKYTHSAKPDIKMPVDDVVTFSPSPIQGTSPRISPLHKIYFNVPGTNLKGIFNFDENAKMVSELRQAFDSGPSYGVNLDLSRYGFHDVTAVLLEYLHHLPDSVVPYNCYKKLEVGFIVLREQTRRLGAYHDHELRRQYFSICRRIMMEIPLVNLQLLMCILDLLNFLAKNSLDEDGAAQILARIFGFALINRSPWQFHEVLGNQPQIEYILTTMILQLDFLPYVTEITARKGNF